MADTETTKISGPFGTERVAVPEPSTAGQPLASQAQPDGPRIALDDNLMRNDAGVQEARQARETRALRPDASVLESVGAAVNSWDTTRLVKRLIRPSFDDDTPISQGEYLNHVPLVLTEDEREYFLAVGKGRVSAEYAIDQIKDRRMSQEVLGDSPVAGTLASFMDPLWMLVPPAVRMGKASPVAGRAVSAAFGAATAGAVTALGEGPVSDADIAMNMLLNGAAGAALYRPGKGLVRADPEFPEARLGAALDVAEAGSEAAMKPRYKLVQPEVWEDVTVPGTPAVYKDVPNSPIPALERATPNYGYKGTNYPVQFQDAMDKAAYIVAGKGKSKAHDEIVQWAQAQGVPEADLLAHGQAIRDDLKVKAAGGAAELQALRGKHSTASTRVEVSPEVPGRVERRKLQDAKYEEVPQPLRAGVVNTEQAVVAEAVEQAVDQEARSIGMKPGRGSNLGEKLMWNMHKSMSNFGEEGKRVANLLYDNNSDLSITSIESHREAIMSDLKVHQFEYETMLRDAMKESGFGIGKRVNPFTAREAYQAQMKIERDVQRELFRREQAVNRGGSFDNADVPKHITAMADELDKLHAKALKEMQASGVKGAESILERPGYLNRKWSSQHIDSVLGKLEAMGLTREQGHLKVEGLVSLALRRANNFDKKMGDQIASAIVDRALRKGYFEDSVFNAPAGAGQLAEMRDVLKSGGMAAEDIERALNVLRVASDDAGKAGVLKHRMDLDYRAQMRVGGETVSIMDLIDGRVNTIVDQYTRRVATESAFARKGYGSRSDIEKLRSDLLHDTPADKREQAKELFDNSVAHLRGEAAGAKVNENFRLLQSYGRMVSLAWSGLWQLTEYATAMGEYGMLKTLKYAAQEIPGFKQIMQSTDKADMRSLNNVLADHSSQGLRLRPYIAKYEDGFEMDTSSALQLSAQAAGQLVPYANAMAFVHHHQARMVGNLILDRLQMAAKGNAKAREALAKYGIEAHVMDKLAKEVDTHGFNVDSWNDKVWADVRPGFAKMMDSAVLQGRLGDMPTFAAFDNVGKMVFTYRTFVLTAHNKVLAGTLARDGAAAMGLALMYQFPLALAAVQAQNVINGGKSMTSEDLAKKAVGQMGGLGLFSEPFKWITGESNSVGAPALIPLDRGVKLLQAGVNADADKAASTALTMLPVVAANPFIKGMAQQIKE